MLRLRGGVQIFVKTLSGKTITLEVEPSASSCGKTITLEVEPSASIDDVKAKIQDN